MFIILFLAISFVFVSLLLSLLGLVFSYKEKCNIGLSSYECGFTSSGYPLIGFSIQFYLLLVVFVVFDLEVVLFLGFVYSSFNSVLLFFLFWLFAIFTFYLEFMLGSFNWKS